MTCTASAASTYAMSRSYLSTAHVMFLLSGAGPAGMVASVTGLAIAPESKA